MATMRGGGGGGAAANGAGGRRATTRGGGRSDDAEPTMLWRDLAHGRTCGATSEPPTRLEHGVQRGAAAAAERQSQSQVQCAERRQWRAAFATSDGALLLWSTGSPGGGGTWRCDRLGASHMCSLAAETLLCSVLLVLSTLTVDLMPACATALLAVAIVSAHAAFTGYAAMCAASPRILYCRIAALGTLCAVDITIAIVSTALCIRQHFRQGHRCCYFMRVVTSAMLRLADDCQTATRMSLIALAAFSSALALCHIGATCTAVAYRRQIYALAAAQRVPIALKAAQSTGGADAGNASEADSPTDSGFR